MYKGIFTHQIMPGKLEALKAFLQERINKARASNPDQVPVKRYLSLVGDVTLFMVEVDMEKLPEMSASWMERETAEFQQLTVPGSSRLQIFRQMEFE